MPYLTGNTTVRHGFRAVALAEGEELPEWAEGQVGDHLLSDTKPKPAKVQEAAPVASEPEQAAGVPDDSWTNKQIKQYAEDNGIDLGEATTKPAMLAAISGDN